MTPRATPEWIGRRPESMPTRKVLAPDRRHHRGAPMTLDVILAASMPEPNSGCWIWAKSSVSPNGYGIIRHLRKNYFAHRLAYQVKHDVIVPPDIDVCHICDNRLCVNPDHLFLGTRSDNMRDCVKKGRNHHPDLRGSQLTQAKLTEDDIPTIRTDTRSTRVLAREYGVSRHTISLVKRRLIWRHVI